MELRQTFDGGSELVQLLCEHCHLPCFEKVYFDSHEHAFCCVGCRAVYQFIQKSGLGRYYTLQEQTPGLASQKKRISKDFQYLDQPEFLDKFVTSSPLNKRCMKFYVEGMHCLACLWILEKMKDQVPGVLQAQVDLSNSSLSVTLKPEGHFSEMAQYAHHLGYTLHPLAMNESSEQHQQQAERQDLIRLGVAGASAANAMLFSVALYAGVSDRFAELFRWLVLTCSLPALTYGAWPFLRQSFFALKTKIFSLDIALSVALFLGFGLSLFNFAQGSSDIYFESLAMLIFLLLTSRYLLKKATQKGLSAHHLLQFFQAEKVLKLSETAEERLVPLSMVQKGDKLRVAKDQLIPADGILISDECYLETALLTGESHPSHLLKGDALFSGMLNRGKSLDLKVSAVGLQTRLGKILNQVEQNNRQQAPVVRLADKRAQQLLLLTLLLATIAVVWQGLNGEWRQGIERALSLVIVACPCALGLGTPFALTRGLSLAAGKGILVKNETVLERLQATRKIFLDKTGTLTEGLFSVSFWKDDSHSAAGYSNQQLVYSLEQNSAHPLASSLKNYLSDEKTSLSFEWMQEVSGRGIEATKGGNHYRLEKVEEPLSEFSGSLVGLFENGKRLALIGLEDELKPGSKAVVKRLQQKGYELSLLSGDREESVKSIANKLGIKNYQAALMPEDKQKILMQNPGALMVGDGANDALALSHPASIGLAIRGSAEVSLRAADIYLSQERIELLEQLLTLSCETFRVIKRNLNFALIYNGLGMSLALVGLIHPLGAAVLMPLSSFTVLASTFWGTKKLRKF